MDNFTMLQNAARRQIDGERTGFASLSRVDQADRWAAGENADMPRARRYFLRPGSYRFALR